jgi:uncharacterized protein with PIN domain
MSLTPTVCYQSRLEASRPVLFEEENHLSEVTIVRDHNDSAQKAFADLLRGLFHWQLDTTDQRAYSLAPADYSRLPLFSFAGETIYLNQVFWLVYD